MPAIQAISERGQCFCVIDNVPAEATAAQLLRKIDRVDAVRTEAESAAEGFKTADACGAFLQKMERYVGGPRRVIAPGYYAEVYEKLCQLDPRDETGWIRHFELGVKVELADANGKTYNHARIMRSYVRRLGEDAFRELAYRQWRENAIDGEPRSRAAAVEETVRRIKAGQGQNRWLGKMLH